MQMCRSKAIAYAQTHNIDVWLMEEENIPDVAINSDEVALFPKLQRRQKKRNCVCCDANK